MCYNPDERRMQKMRTCSGLLNGGGSGGGGGAGVSKKSKSERGSEKTPFIECMHSRKPCEDL